MLCVFVTYDPAPLKGQGISCLLSTRIRILSNPILIFSSPPTQTLSSSLLKPKPHLLLSSNPFLICFSPPTQTPLLLSYSTQTSSPSLLQPNPLFLLYSNPILIFSSNPNLIFSSSPTQSSSSPLLNPILIFSPPPTQSSSSPLLQLNPHLLLSSYPFLIFSSPLTQSSSSPLLQPNPHLLLSSNPILIFSSPPNLSSYFLLRLSTLRKHISHLCLILRTLFLNRKEEMPRIFANITNPSQNKYFSLINFLVNQMFKTSFILF